MHVLHYVIVFYVNKYKSKSKASAIIFSKSFQYTQSRYDSDDEQEKEEGEDYYKDVKRRKSNLISRRKETPSPVLAGTP